MTFLIIALSFVSLIMLVLLYVSYTLYKKVVFYERWYENLSVTVENIYENLKTMDVSGAMEADDEVGVFFDALRGMFTELFAMGFYDDEKIKSDFGSP